MEVERIGEKCLGGVGGGGRERVVLVWGGVWG